MIHWSVTSTLGTIVGPVRVESEQSASSRAELVIIGSATPGQAVTISYSGQQLFSGYVDESHDLGNGHSRVECTSDLQGKVNAMTRAQIDALIPSHWHPALSDDDKRGWDYAEDRLKTFFGSLQLVNGQPVAVPWAADTAIPGDSVRIEESLEISTPAYTDLTAQVILEVEYRYPTFEEATATYEWSLTDYASGFEPWWPPGVGDVSASAGFFGPINRESRKKLDALTPQAHEILAVAASTEWRYISSTSNYTSYESGNASNPLANYQANNPGTVPVEQLQVADGTEAEAQQLSPRVSSFELVLGKRFKSLVNVSGEVAVGSGARIKRERIAYQFEPQYPAGWRETGPLPNPNWQADLNDWVHAHRLRVAKEMAEARRGNTATYQIACNPSVTAGGAVVAVQHDLDPDAGTALSTVTVSRHNEQPPAMQSVSLGALPSREAGPQHQLKTRIIHGFGGEQPLIGSDAHGLTATVNGQIISQGGNQYHIITAANRNRFSIPAPQYTDTGNRERHIL